MSETKCERCGSEVRKGAKHCGNCGLRVAVPGKLILSQDLAFLVLLGVVIILPASDRVFIVMIHEEYFANIFHAYMGARFIAILYFASGLYQAAFPNSPGIIRRILVGVFLIALFFWSLFMALGVNFRFQF